MGCHVYLPSQQRQKREVEAVVDWWWSMQCSVWESWSSDNRAGSVTPSPESRRKSSSAQPARLLQQQELETQAMALAQGHWKGLSSVAAISQFCFCFTCWLTCSFLVSWPSRRLSKRLRSCGQLKDRCRELGLEKFGQTMRGRRGIFTRGLHLLTKLLLV